MDERFKALRIIWLALVGGVAMWTTVAFGLVVLGVMDEGVLPRPLLPMVASGAAVVMVLGMVLRRRTVEAIPPGTGTEERFAKYQAAVIVGLAMVEGGGLLLITVGLAAAAPAWILAGGVAAALAMAIARPTREEAGLRGPGR